ncbi:hypothetical protein [Ovoidimarina sediminis]|uniref:hypothetical protein n=1 Tax=Ovoidimarina sediminis TaxID=3079856 RepID=UPI002910A45C|nr:hypothetical protein [Rhodophyticola sp. MJ-SS7]MDU8942787.1 hypothetical protein [Rhodophyticola sp. MJ-SS7]
MFRVSKSAALAAGVAAACLFGAVGASAQSAGEMSFFISSVGSGDGANFGGLEGADAHCTALAEAAGSSKTWAAYLSTSMVIDRSSGSPQITDGVSARDRIGSGPWYNAAGVMIAKDVDDLHSASVNLNLETGLDENGNQVNGRGSQPNKHDILTGSDSAGHFSTAGGDTTCSNWTSNGEGSAIVGHHDRLGLNSSRNMLSWNSSHGTAGCSEEALPRTGGAGLIYCFATD